jgi:quercetin dioxygenase-like cupin family protein
LIDGGFKMMTSIAAEPANLNVLGTEMIVTIDSRDTNGTISAVETVVEPGDGPPLHVHTREDELFYILEGNFRVWRGDDVLDVGAGAYAFLPRNVPHTFQNIDNGPSRLLVVITPGGFENFFKEVSDRRLAVPDDMAALTKLAADFGLEFVGPPPPRPEK